MWESEEYFIRKCDYGILKKFLLSLKKLHFKRDSPHNYSFKEWGICITGHTLMFYKKTDIGETKPMIIGGKLYNFNYDAKLMINQYSLLFYNQSDVKIASDLLEIIFNSILNDIKRELKYILRKEKILNIK